MRPAGGADSPSSAFPATSSAAGPVSGSRTALLADEAREYRDVVAAALREAGFEVSVTDDGEEALLLAGSHRFDLILLNVYLRRLLGIHVCERIKSDPNLKATPVILMMGAAPKPGEPPASPRNLYGADDFLPTRLGREELLARIGGARKGTPAPVAPPAPPAGRVPSGEEAEIRRLARIMVSDIQMYHPEKFNRALRDGTFFEAFSEELGKGKEIVDQRFGHLGNRIQLLAAGLRDTLEAYRTGESRRASGG